MLKRAWRRVCCGSFLLFFEFGVEDEILPEQSECPQGVSQMQAAEFWFVYRILEPGHDDGRIAVAAENVLAEVR